MPSEITDSAYQDHRDHIMSNYNHLELLEGVTTHYTIDITGSWVQDPNNDGSDYLLQVEETVTGSEIGVGTTVDTSAVYDVDGGDLKGENTQASFTFETEEDELTVVHQFEIPQEA